METMETFKEACVISNPVTSAVELVPQFKVGQRANA